MTTVEFSASADAGAAIMARVWPEWFGGATGLEWSDPARWNEWVERRRASHGWSNSPGSTIEGLPWIRTVVVAGGPTLGVAYVPGEWKWEVDISPTVPPEWRWEERLRAEVRKLREAAR